MHAGNNSAWNWIWPYMGATPVTQGLDLEMFDRSDYPYSETFVREAVQNSLDARLNRSKPVRIHFTFHEKPREQCEAFLSEVISFREKAGLETPTEWTEGHIKWLAVEDFHSKGLSGSLTERTSDFWNYWLNFGISNKDGSGRGGRGVGRITFLIASRLWSVIGYTRRSEDGQSAVCGMSALRAQQEGDGFRSTHAYLASAQKDPIYALYDSEDFINQARNAFCFSGYDGEFASGLALAIPYPNDKLTQDGILAAAIENFAPAVMSGDLVLNVDGRILDESSITEIAEDVSENFNDVAIQKDVTRYLHLIKCAGKQPTLEITWPEQRSELDVLREEEVVKSIRERLDDRQDVVLSVNMLLEQNGEQEVVKLRAAIATTPSEKKPIDRLFRDGMSLPDVRTKNDPGQIDLVLLVEDPLLVTYLNFCEGKAHLDLLENEEVKQKLRKEGFSGGITVKRTVKNFSGDMRRLLSPDISEPVADVFLKFFSIPEEESPGKPRPPRPGPDDGPDDPDLPPSSTSPFLVDRLPEGFHIRANPEYEEENWPINLTATLAYADGSRRPSWDKYDFRLEKLSVSHKGCKIKTKKDNKLRACDCGPDCSIEVIGFDTKRELDTSIRWDRDAQKD